ncbi:MAG: hypothetical protein P4M11_12005 [Candidatus Pacebacteria bacterium]|nr:hypothetical protein [Candidatus Paceibacterota bacterium]
MSDDTVKDPVLSVENSLVSFVAVFTRDTAAPGTAAAVASVTAPLIEPTIA